MEAARRLTTLREEPPPPSSPLPHTTAHSTESGVAPAPPRADLRARSASFVLLLCGRAPPRAGDGVAPVLPPPQQRRGERAPELAVGARGEKAHEEARARCSHKRRSGGSGATAQSTKNIATPPSRPAISCAFLEPCAPFEKGRSRVLRRRTRKAALGKPRVRYVRIGNNPWKAPDVENFAWLPVGLAPAKSARSSVSFI